MVKFLAIILIYVFAITTSAHADYVVKDGSGNSITIKSLPISPGQMPQSVPTDQNGSPFSNSNPLAVKSPGGNGASGGANPPSLSGLTLLNSYNANPARTLLQVGVNCAEGLYVVLDDQQGGLTPIIIILDGPPDNKLQGGTLTNTVHTGRVRFYSANPSCQYWAGQWP